MPRKKKDFWNEEYRRATHLALSTEHSEDLEKFTRFLERQSGRALLNVTSRFVDIGCGNGRNALYLAETFSMHGLAFDSSSEAIHQARNAAAALVQQNSSEKFPVEFVIRDMREPIPLPDASTVLVLDMMTSHILKKEERGRLKDEILRILKPDGWLFFKTFLRDGDRNADRLLKEFPAEEEGMYIHPEIGVPERAWWERDIYEFFEPEFTIRKFERSHKHINKRGGAWKRRTVSVYLQRS